MRPVASNRELQQVRSSGVLHEFRTIKNKRNPVFWFLAVKTPTDMEDADAVTANAAKIKVVYRNKIVHSVDTMTKIVTSTLIYERRNRQ